MASEKSEPRRRRPILAGMLQRPSLRLVFLLQVVLPVLVAVLMTFYGGLYAVQQLIEQRMKEDIELVARAIRMPVSYSLRYDQPVNLYNALESVFEIGRVYGASVYDDDGNRVAAVGMDEEEDEADIDVQALLSSMEGDLKGGGSYERIAGQRLYSYFIPLVGPEGEQAGMLHVTRRFSDFTDYMSDLRVRAIASFGLVVLFIVGLILLGHNRAIGRPLRNLVYSMERVKHGNLAHRAEVSGPRELEALSTVFNDMLDGVERARAEILQRARTEKDLADRLRESEKLAAIGRLAAGVAHELGTPLSVIDGKARRLARRQDTDATARENLQDIRSEVQRLSRIVRQLLDFGRGHSYDHRAVSMVRVCRSALAGVRDAAAQHRVDVTYEPPGDQLEVTGDPLRLEQAVGNLLRNALQAATGGRVWMTTHAEDAEVVVRVKDSGPGVPPEQRGRVFEPFYTTKPVGAGTGLGLSVVRGVAEEHGGAVAVGESHDLGGACFELRLPRLRGRARGRDDDDQA